MQHLCRCEIVHFFERFSRGVKKCTNSSRKSRFLCRFTGSKAFCFAKTKTTHCVHEEKNHASESSCNDELLYIYKNHQHQIHQCLLKKQPKTTTLSYPPMHPPDTPCKTLIPERHMPTKDTYTTTNYKGDYARNHYRKYTEAQCKHKALTQSSDNHYTPN